MPYSSFPPPPPPPKLPGYGAAPSPDPSLAPALPCKSPSPPSSPSFDGLGAASPHHFHHLHPHHPHPHPHHRYLFPSYCSSEPFAAPPSRPSRLARAHSSDLALDCRSPDPEHEDPPRVAAPQSDPSSSSASSSSSSSSSSSASSASLPMDIAMASPSASRSSRQRTHPPHVKTRILPAAKADNNSNNKGKSRRLGSESHGEGEGDGEDVRCGDAVAAARAGDGYGSNVDGDEDEDEDEDGLIEEDGVYDADDDADTAEELFHDCYEEEEEGEEGEEGDWAGDMKGSSIEASMASLQATGGSFRKKQSPLRGSPSTRGAGGSMARLRPLQRTRTRSLTDEDLEELRGSIELGFGFGHEHEDHNLKSTLPALELYYAINRHYNSNSNSICSSSSSINGTKGRGSPITPLERTSSAGSNGSAASNETWRISSPGDHPSRVKTRLRHWAQVVACSIKQSF